VSVRGTAAAGSTDVLPLGGGMTRDRPSRAAISSASAGRHLIRQRGGIILASEKAQYGTGMPFLTPGYLNNVPH
jgi:hypothetical protein